MAKFRNGDIVSVKCIVESHLGVDDLRVRPIDSYADIFVKREHVNIIRHDIKIGDFVQLIEMDLVGEVLAMAEDHVWVTFGTGSYGTWWIDKVSRVDPDEMRNPVGEIIQSDAGESMEAEPLTGTSPVGSVSPTPVPSDA